MCFYFLYGGQSWLRKLYGRGSGWERRCERERESEREREGEGEQSSSSESERRPGFWAGAARAWLGVKEGGAQRVCFALLGLTLPLRSPYPVRLPYTPYLPWYTALVRWGSAAKCVALPRIGSCPDPFSCFKVSDGLKGQARNDVCVEVFEQGDCTFGGVDADKIGWRHDSTKKRCLAQQKSSTPLDTESAWSVSFFTRHGEGHGARPGFSPL
ncbi:hypothetical protein VTO42DRAFT_5309 [Malbranchea cinnamomea]